MDYLKTRAPFWKKEATADGGRWVDARETDDSAAARWHEVKQGSAGSFLLKAEKPFFERLNHWPERPVEIFSGVLICRVSEILPGDSPCASTNSPPNSSKPWVTPRAWLSATTSSSSSRNT